MAWWAFGGFGFEGDGWDFVFGDAAEEVYDEGVVAHSIWDEYFVFGFTAGLFLRAWACYSLQ